MELSGDPKECTLEKICAEVGKVTDTDFVLLTSISLVTQNILC